MYVNWHAGKSMATHRSFGFCALYPPLFVKVHSTVQHSARLLSRLVAPASGGSQPDPLDNQPSPVVAHGREGEECGYRAQVAEERRGEERGQMWIHSLFMVSWERLLFWHCPSVPKNVAPARFSMYKSKSNDSERGTRKGIFYGLAQTLPFNPFSPSAPTHNFSSVTALPPSPHGSRKSWRTSIHP